MSDNNWIQKYNLLSNSFKNTLVFGVGAVAGFFSDFDHLVFAVAYCLSGQILLLK